MTRIFTSRDGRATLSADIQQQSYYDQQLIVSPQGRSVRRNLKGKRLTILRLALVMGTPASTAVCRSRRGGCGDSTPSSYFFPLVFVFSMPTAASSTSIYEILHRFLDCVNRNQEPRRDACRCLVARHELFPYSDVAPKIRTNLRKNS